MCAAAKWSLITIRFHEVEHRRRSGGYCNSMGWKRKGHTTRGDHRVRANIISRSGCCAICCQRVRNRSTHSLPHTHTQTRTHNVTLTYIFGCCSSWDYTALSLIAPVLQKALPHIFPLPDPHTWRELLCLSLWSHAEEENVSRKRSAEHGIQSPPALVNRRISEVRVVVNQFFMSLRHRLPLISFAN